MEFVNEIKSRRKIDQRIMASWPLPMMAFKPIMEIGIGIGKDNINFAQLMTRFPHPVSPLTYIKRVKIPLRPDVAPQGLKVDEQTGILKAEWVHYNGFFKKVKEDPNDPGFVHPDERYASSAIHPKRVILYAHGGIYCLCSPAIYRGYSWRLSKYAQSRVLVIDYRLAPQSQYPAQLHDMLSAYMYLIDPPKGQLRYRPDQVVFSGDSAGGNVSVAACLWLRDSKKGYPQPAGMVLSSPWVRFELIIDCSVGCFPFLAILQSQRKP